jgi:Arc/MetJ-type ribon-helix-helix transcriptional regulator
MAKNNTQINLKLPFKLMELAEEYADSYGYTNVQELIRESLREKVFSEKVREEYIDKLIEDEKDSNWLGEQKSNDLLLILGEKALEYKKNEKN